MKTVIRVLIAATALLLVSVALADQKPELVEESDLLRVQLAQAYAELRERIAADAKREAEAAITAFRAKYKLNERDTIDPQTRQIRRTPKQGAK